jgi:hypothetical protein
MTNAPYSLSDGQTEKAHAPPTNNALSHNGEAMNMKINLIFSCFRELNSELPFSTLAVRSCG